MPITGITLVEEWTRDSGRWVAAARASRRPPSAPEPAPAEVLIADDREPDDSTTWASQRGMTLAAAQAAYASN
jgi:hypothetical protein